MKFDNGFDPMIITKELFEWRYIYRVLFDHRIAQATGSIAFGHPRSSKLAETNVGTSQF